MKNLLFLCLISITLIQCTPNNDADTVAVKETAEQAAVKDVVEKAYVEGLLINRDTAAILEGFHPNFVMFVSEEGNTVSQVPIADWVARLQASKDENPEPHEYTTTHKFSVVDITGDAAMVKVEVYRDEKHVFTDYLSLYNKENGWKIVGKVYHRY